MELKFPLYAKSRHTRLVVKFETENTGEVVEADERYGVGYRPLAWSPIFDNETWEILPFIVSEPTEAEIGDMEKDTKISSSNDSGHNNFYDSHYRELGIDTFQRAEANMSKSGILDSICFNIDKYNWRKKGQDKEDFTKIIAYAKWGLEILENDSIT